ncbi:hypothetical protein [Paenibacillus sp. NPDC058071]|uniref:hypothetical protein n=1 Tax=Paenibacillus sp. NPDC058071 TaxID=3346326 RepID=UPI0036DB5214
MSANRRFEFHAALWAVAISVIYAIFGNTFFYLASRYTMVLDQSYTVFILFAAMIAASVIWRFRSRYWYFPLFIPILWIPFTVIFAFLMSAVFPLPEDNLGGGLMVLFIHGLNLGAVLIGVALGMAVNAAAVAWKKFGRE